MNGSVTAMYFSATGTTEKIVVEIAQALAEAAGGGPPRRLDFTPPAARREAASFAAGDVVVIGAPVYAGRVPNVLLGYLRSLAGGGALAAAVVAYGNRDYDDALIELADLLAAGGFRVVAAGAFIGAHSFSDVLAAGRPDAADLAAARRFAGRIAAKLDGPAREAAASIRGRRPYRPYYMPQDEQGRPVDIRKVKPKTRRSCTQCKLCAAVCPMGSIDLADATQVTGICIKCGACIKKCPVGAKYYDDEGYLRHKRELELQCAARREPELFA